MSFAEKLFLITIEPAIYNLQYIANIVFHRNKVSLNECTIKLTMLVNSLQDMYTMFIISSILIHCVTFFVNLVRFGPTKLPEANYKTPGGRDKTREVY